MSKKNKNFNKDFASESPEIYNTDDIGYMPDEAINDRANRLESERNRLVSMGKDPYLWEVEIAYLRREQQVRHVRAECHAEFLKKFSNLSEVDEIANSTLNNSDSEPTLN